MQTVLDFFGKKIAKEVIQFTIVLDFIWTNTMKVIKSIGLVLSCLSTTKCQSHN